MYVCTNGWWEKGTNHWRISLLQINNKCSPWNNQHIIKPCNITKLALVTVHKKMPVPLLGKLKSLQWCFNQHINGLNTHMYFRCMWSHEAEWRWTPHSRQLPNYLLAIYLFSNKTSCLFIIWATWKSLRWSFKQHISEHVLQIQYTIKMSMNSSNTRTLHLFTPKLPILQQTTSLPFFTPKTSHCPCKCRMWEAYPKTC